MFVCTIIIIATLCLWCIFHAGSALKALGWSKTSKNLRDRSFESRVEVCLQDLHFFKKYLQTWGGGMFLVQKFLKFPYLSHTRLPKSSWFPVNGGGGESSRWWGSVRAQEAETSSLEQGECYFSFLLRFLSQCFIPSFKPAWLGEGWVKQIRVSPKLCLTCWKDSVF